MPPRRHKIGKAPAQVTRCVEQRVLDAPHLLGAFGGKKMLTVQPKHFFLPGPRITSASNREIHQQYLEAAINQNYICPVCGYPELREEPHGVKSGASDEICPSCGFQFGFSDDSQGFTYEQWRKKWVENGMIWQSKGRQQPFAWDPVEQIRKLGEDRT